MHIADRTADRSVDHLSERANQVGAGLLDRSLPKPEWTHDAHLLACISLIRRSGAAEALSVLRTAIPRYNESTGVVNTSTSGYHDTITVYYVWAIDRLLADGRTASEILDHRLVERAAAIAFWNRDVLMSPAARAGWTPPQRATDDGSPALPTPSVALGDDRIADVGWPGGIPGQNTSAST